MRKSLLFLSTVLVLLITISLYDINILSSTFMTSRSYSFDEDDGILSFTYYEEERRFGAYEQGDGVEREQEYNEGLQTVLSSTNMTIVEGEKNDDKENKKKEEEEEEQRLEIVGTTHEEMNTVVDGLEAALGPFTYNPPQNNNSAAKTPTSKFYEWDDERGVDIASILSHLEWFVTVRANQGKRWDDLPKLPIRIHATREENKEQNPPNIQVEYSSFVMNHFQSPRHFIRDRVKPFINFMISALNQEKVIGKNAHTDNDTSTEFPVEKQHRWSRLFEVLLGGSRDLQIPLLIDISDKHDCGENFFKDEKDIKQGEAPIIYHLPIFTLARRVECKFNFPVPTYLAIRSAKENQTEWDSYFTKSDEMYPWQNKLSAAVWRGTNTGRSRKFNREWLVAYGEFINKKFGPVTHKEEVGPSNTKGDAYTIKGSAYNRTTQEHPLIDTQLCPKSSPEYRMEFEDFQRYKAIIDIDGNGWSGRFTRLLCMNSVVIKLTPESVEYYNGNLLPWVHYIPVENTPLGATTLNNTNTSRPATTMEARVTQKKNYNRRQHNDSVLSRIPTSPLSLYEGVKFATAKENEDFVKGIIQNARAWCRENLFLPTMRDDMLDILSSYVLELDKGDADWGAKWKKEVMILNNQDSSSFSLHEKLGFAQ